VKLLAAAAICFLVAVNCWDVGTSARIQNGFTFAKLLALALIIVIGVVEIINGNHPLSCISEASSLQHFWFQIFLSPGGNNNFADPFKDSNWGVGSITLAFFSGIYAYGGANTLNFMTEEVRDPTK